MHNVSRRGVDRERIVNRTLNSRRDAVSIRPDRDNEKRKEDSKRKREKKSRKRKAKNDEIPRNGRRSRKAIYLLEALLSPAIRERACRQIRHASRTRRINLVTKDPAELPCRRRWWLARERKKKQSKTRGYEASCVMPRTITNIVSHPIYISKT